LNIDATKGTAVDGQPIHHLQSAPQ